MRWALWRCAGAVLALFATGFAGAQEITPDSAYLFVSSEPFGATITINETESGLETPALLRLAPGSYDISLARSGHEAVTLTVEVETPAATVSAPLPAQYVTVDIPEEPGSSSETLPTGVYRFDRAEGAVSIAPQYEREGLRTAAQALFPAAIGIAAAVSVWSYAAPPESAEGAVVPAVITQLIAGGAGTALLFIEIDRSNFLSRWRPPPNPYFPAAAALLLEQARDELEQGDLPQAIALFHQLRREHPDAPGVPEALYTAGRLAALEGDPEGAQTMLTELVMHYPTIEFYDRALVQLARLAAEAGDTETANRFLDEITYSDPSVTQTDVAALRNVMQ